MNGVFGPFVCDRELLLEGRDLLLGLSQILLEVIEYLIKALNLFLLDFQFGFILLIDLCVFLFL